MIQIISGETGAGKTKQLIDLANTQTNSVKGQIVYIDSTCKNRYNLSHQIRLIEANTFPITSSQDFFGFLCGVLSSNHDIELIVIDELTKLTRVGLEELSHFIDNLKSLSEDYKVDFVLGASCSSNEVPVNLAPYLVA